MFSCEFCEISKDTFFKEHLRPTASDFIRTLTLKLLKNSNYSKIKNSLRTMTRLDARVKENFKGEK